MSLLSFLQTKYDASQQARKHLLPVSTADLNSRERPHNGVLFPPHGDLQYGRGSILTDHFQYGRPGHPNLYTLNRYDV